jgi:hypothetical protein
VDSIIFIILSKIRVKLVVINWTVLKILKKNKKKKKC